MALTTIRRLSLRSVVGRIHPRPKSCSCQQWSVARRPMRCPVSLSSHPGFKDLEKRGQFPDRSRVSRREAPSMTDGSHFKKPVGIGERIDVRVERRTARGGIVVIRQRIAAHGVSWLPVWLKRRRTDSEVLAVNNAYNEPLSYVSSECRDQNRFSTTLHCDLAREPAMSDLLDCFYGWLSFPAAMHLFLASKTIIPSSTYAHVLATSPEA